MNPPRPKKSRWIPILQVIVGLGLMALVAYFVPWRDRLIWSDDSGKRSFDGAIEGEWKSEAIDFAFDVRPADLPAALATATNAADGVAKVHVVRDEHVDWRPGLLRVFRELDTSGLLKAFACLCCGLTFTVLRWWRLLLAAGCRATPFQSLRLTLLGMFFNIVVPGLTGGDVIKAVLVARESPGKKTEAVISVFVDRIIGIVVLAAIAAVVIVATGESAFAAIRTPVIAAASAGVLGAFVYVNGTLRRWIGLDRLLAKLPGGALFQKIDQAVLVYSRHPWEMLGAFLLSVGNHLSVVLGVLALGRAFGDTVATLDYFVAVPVANIATALPLSPGGWGFGEAVFGTLWEMLGGSASLGIATSVTFRLLLLSFGLVGGLFLLVPGGRLDLEQVERESKS
ncbi:MAG: flippase-like domain-containing protein [Planctomycetes bacterium]|nr:flippase-like domain-containing protein [Planctomycetota bacterium]